MDRPKRLRSGISQTISLIVLIILLSLSVVAFSFVLQQSSRVQGAQLTVMYQEVQKAKEDLRITIYPEYIWLGAPENRFVNATKIRITSNWAGESTIDYIVAVKLGGERVEGPVDIRVGAFENVEDLKPSNLHPGLVKYDNDYNALTDEVDYILLHTKLGNVFKASIGDSTQKIVSSITSTTTTQTSWNVLTKVLMSTTTETKTDWRCRNGWPFIGWVSTYASVSSKATGYTISSPLVGKVTVTVSAPSSSCITSRSSTSREYGTCTVYSTRTASGCGTLIGYWLDAAYTGCCTYSCQNDHWVTTTTSRTTFTGSAGDTTRLTCATGTRKCTSQGAAGWYAFTCWCYWSTCAEVLYCKSGGCKVSQSTTGSNYIVVDYSLASPGEIGFTYYWEPKYSIYLCSTVLITTRCSDTGSTTTSTTAECPSPACQEGATTCMGVDLYRCGCTYSSQCQLCSWSLYREEAPECGAVCSPVTSTTTVTTTTTKTETTLVGPIIPTTVTTTATTTKWACVVGTVQNQFSVCGPTTIRTTRSGAEPIIYCTATITPIVASAPTPQEYSLALSGRDGAGTMAFLFIILGAVALPSGRRPRFWALILLSVFLLYLTMSTAPHPVSAACTPSTTTTTTTKTVTTTITMTITTSGTITITITTTATKTLTTTTSEVIIATKYSYKTCEYWTDIIHERYCKCGVTGGNTYYSDCQDEWVTRTGGPEYEGFAGTSVTTITTMIGTCPT